MANIGVKLDILSNDMKDLQLGTESILLLWGFRVSCSLFLRLPQIRGKTSFFGGERFCCRFQWFSISKPPLTFFNWHFYPNYDNGYFKLESLIKKLWCKFWTIFSLTKCPNKIIGLNAFTLFHRTRKIETFFLWANNEYIMRGLLKFLI